jgi:hypothetical protein
VKLGIEEAINPALVLVMPDREKPFFVYCDALGQGAGCVLMQDLRGTICFKEVNKTLRALSCLRFGVSRCGSRSQDLEVLPYGKDMSALYRL